MACHFLRRVWWLCLGLLLCFELTSGSKEVVYNNSTTNNTNFIILLKPPADPPHNFSPVSVLHEHASNLSQNIPGIEIIHTYDNIAKYLKIYLFSIQLEKSDDLPLVGSFFHKEMKSIEAVSYFYAAELVTDVRNLAHGLPYRQVLNRPFRDLQEISGDRVEIQDIACTIESQIKENLTQSVDFKSIEEEIIRALSQTDSESIDEEEDDNNSSTSHNEEYAYDYGGKDLQMPEAPVTVFVMDTGIQSNHSWFASGQVTRGFDFDRKRHTTIGHSSVEDPNGHGTQIAGIIGGKPPMENEENEGASNKDARRSSRLVSVRVLDTDGRGKSDDIIAGLDFIIGAYMDMKHHNPRTSKVPQAHMSALTHMSFSGRSSEILKLILNAVSKVIPVVGASGDDDSFSCWTTPADCKNAIVVGASMPVSNLPLTGSNFGECISMNAPGHQVHAPYIGDSNTEGKLVTGSSASAGVVSAILVNIFTIMDTSQRLHASFHKQIAEIDVSVFLKAVLTEAVAGIQTSRNFNTYAEVHQCGYTPCAIDSHKTIRLKLEERLKKTVSKGFLDEVQYDEDAPKVDSPTKRLRDRFKNLKKDNN